MLPQDTLALLGLVLMLITVFTFVVLMTWIGTKQKEREAYYKSESLRHIAEIPGDGARQVIELIQQESRAKRIKSREGVKLGGIINIAVGLGLFLLMRSLGAPSLVGAIPGLIGVGLLVYAFFLAPRVE